MYWLDIHILLYFLHLIETSINTFNPLDQQTEEVVNPPDDCAVMGVYSPHTDAFELGFTIIKHSVNRGTDSNGISTLRADGTFYTQKELGKPRRSFYTAVPANLVNGHDRYTTAEETNSRNAQPCDAVSPDGVWTATLAHNGNLDREEIAAHLKIFPEGTSDSAYMAQLLVESPGATWMEKIKNAYPHLNGSFSSVLLTSEGLYGFCDRRQNRPLWLSKHADGTVVITSETFPVDQLPNGAEYAHSPIEAGEVVHIDLGGNIERIQLFNKEELAAREQAFCIEEIVYLERGESLVERGEHSIPIDELRRQAGKQMAREEQQLDFKYAGEIGAVAIPRGGTSYTDGYTEESGVEKFNLLIKILDERSFISNGDQQGVAKKKLAVNMEELERFVNAQKTKLILVDDSLIRGNMMQPTLEMLRNAFKAVGYDVPSIHIRICSPEVYNPCGLGLAIHDRAELFYNREEDPCGALDVASIQHLSHRGILEAFTGEKAIDELRPLGAAYIHLGYCMNCMRRDAFVHPIEWYNKDDKEWAGGIPIPEGTIFSSRKEKLSSMSLAFTE